MIPILIARFWEKVTGRTKNCAGAKAKAANRPGQDRLVHRKICWTHHDPVGQSPVSPCKRWIRLTFGILHVQFFGHLR